MTAFDEPVDYDECEHRNEVDVTGPDSPDGVTERLCSDCGRTVRLSAAEQLPQASLASPVRYRWVTEAETVNTVDGKVDAEPGEVVITHVGRNQQRVLPGWVFAMLYWPDES